MDELPSVPFAWLDKTIRGDLLEAILRLIRERRDFSPESQLVLIHLVNSSAPLSDAKIRDAEVKGIYLSGLSARHLADNTGYGLGVVLEALHQLEYDHDLIRGVSPHQINELGYEPRRTPDDQYKPGMNGFEEGYILKLGPDFAIKREETRQRECPQDLRPPAN